MPRVNYVKKARKDNPVCKAGESYYWWKFRYGGKCYSLTPPKQSQLTQSPYLGAVYSMQETVEATKTDDWDAMAGLIEDIRGEIDSLRDETQCSLDSMPDSLQYGPTGELLQERVSALDSAESELDSIDEWDEDEPDLSDFDTECLDCDGSGEMPVDPDEEDGEMCDCTMCDGSGTVDDEDEFNSEMSDWEERRQDAIDQARDSIIEALDSCLV